MILEYSMIYIKNYIIDYTFIETKLKKAELIYETFTKTI